MQGATALIFHMIFTASVVYQVTTIQLNPLQLVLVGTTLEATVFLFEVPTGIVADAYNRRLSIIIGVALMGIGFVLEGSVPRFDAILIAQLVWGIGATFTSGAGVDFGRDRRSALRRGILARRSDRKLLQRRGHCARRRDRQHRYQPTDRRRRCRPCRAGDLSRSHDARTWVSTCAARKSQLASAHGRNLSTRYSHGKEASRTLDGSRQRRNLWRVQRRLRPAMDRAYAARSTTANVRGFSADRLVRRDENRFRAYQHRCDSVHPQAAQHEQPQRHCPRTLAHQRGSNHVRAHGRFLRRRSNVLCRAGDAAARGSDPRRLGAPAARCIGARDGYLNEQAGEFARANSGRDRRRRDRKLGLDPRCHHRFGRDSLSRTMVLCAHIATSRRTALSSAGQGGVSARRTS